jgi:hypothetical protein
MPAGGRARPDADRDLFEPMAYLTAATTLASTGSGRFSRGTNG